MCGDIIRLEHIKTKKHLHSDTRFESPIVREQEVCCIGESGSDECLH